MRPYVTFAPGKIDDETVSDPATLDPELTKELLGGKGWGLVQMCASGLPVPPGFIITTDVCTAYQRKPKAMMDAIAEDLPEFLKELKALFGGSLPLMSVRSGAPVSMPGMMDTILNVGMLEATFGAWELKLSPLAAADCKRRFLEMYGEIVLGIPKEKFETLKAKALKHAGVSHPMQMSAWKLRNLGHRYTAMMSAIELEAPDNVEQQLLGCIEAVLKSWNNERAIAYRDMHGIDEKMGTAVVVQAMVFGNAGESSGTGVLFTRNPSTGAKGIVGEFLVNAQGEDVVAGTHTPYALCEKPGGVAWLSGPGGDTPTFNGPLDELMKLAHQLEETAGDMQDIEFTIQQGKLWILQTRTGKRSAAATFQIASDMIADGLWTREHALSKLSAREFSLAQRPMLDEAKTVAALGPAIASGVVGSTGALVGRIARDMDDVVQISAQGNPVVLLRHETTPDDIKLMAKSAGILTETGGFTSHAAVVARGMDIVCITGCHELNAAAGVLNGHSFNVGDWITLDGATGKVWLGKGVLSGGDSGPAFALLKDLMTEKGMRPRTTIPTPDAYVDLSATIQQGPLAVLRAMKRAESDGVFVEPKGMTIDLRASQKLDPLDAEFMAATADPSVERVAVEELIDYLTTATNTGDGVQLIMPRTYTDYGRNMLKAQGYTIVPTADTLDEVLAATSTVIISDELRKLAGSSEAWTWLRDQLKAHNPKLDDPIDPGVTLGEAAILLFGTQS